MENAGRFVVAWQRMGTGCFGGSLSEISWTKIAKRRVCGGGSKSGCLEKRTGWMLVLMECKSWGEKDIDIMGLIFWFDGTWGEVRFRLVVPKMKVRVGKS